MQNMWSCCSGLAHLIQDVTLMLGSARKCWRKREEPQSCQKWFSKYFGWPLPWLTCCCFFWRLWTQKHGLLQLAQGQHLPHFWTQQFLSSINRDRGIPVIHTQQYNLYTNVFTEVSASICLSLFDKGFFLIISCVIFLQYRHRNSHVFSLSFSRHFFVSSWFCCLSLGLFSFLLLFFWNRVAETEASLLSPHF